MRISKKNRGRVARELAANEGQIKITAICRTLGFTKQAYYKSQKNRQVKTADLRLAREKVLSIRVQLPQAWDKKAS